jgi:hypothetical protein
MLSCNKYWRHHFKGLSIQKFIFHSQHYCHIPHTDLRESKFPIRKILRYLHGLKAHIFTEDLLRQQT